MRFFFRQMVPLLHTILERGIHFNCCKYTVKYEKKNHWNRKFLVFFHSHKMCLSSIFYSFTDRNGRFLFPFVYFNLLNPYLLIYLINLKPEKGTLLVGASPYGPFNIGHCRGNPSRASQPPRWPIDFINSVDKTNFWHFTDPGRNTTVSLENDPFILHLLDLVSVLYCCWTPVLFVKGLFSKRWIFLS